MEATSAAAAPSAPATTMPAAPATSIVSREELLRAAFKRKSPEELAGLIAEAKAKPEFQIFKTIEKIKIEKWATFDPIEELVCFYDWLSYAMPATQVAPPATPVAPAVPAPPTASVPATALTAAPATVAAPLAPVAPAAPLAPVAPAAPLAPVAPAAPATVGNAAPAIPVEKVAPAALATVDNAAPAIPVEKVSQAPPAIPAPPVALSAPVAPATMVDPAAPATAKVDKTPVFERPKVQATAEQIAQAANAMIKNQKLQEEQKKQDNEYTRRAAANLIKRLKDNPNRIEGMPALKDLVFNEAKKGDLISLMVENGGDLNKVQMHLQMMEESGTINVGRKKALRYTKKQMQDMYGEDAEKVMKHKESTGMTEEDENMPDVKLYLVAQREDEVEDFTRNSILEIFGINFYLGAPQFLRG